MASSQYKAVRLSRRKFLGTTGVAGCGAMLIASSRTALGYQANEQLRLALIGVAGYGSYYGFLSAMHLYENTGISVLCDVDRRKVANALEVWKQRAAEWPSSSKQEERQAAAVYQRLAENVPPLVADFRKMFDQYHNQIDAVVVATPDHTHAVASAAALRAGKPAFCEKPLTINVQEARALYAAAAAKKVATSLGTQGMQSGMFRRGVELVQEGVIGRVAEVHIWFARGGANLSRPPQGSQPVPPELDWDLWLGPVAWREYHPEWIARTHWRDTSAGQLGNFGPHTANLAFMALGVADLWQSQPQGPGQSQAPEAPVIRVEAECSGRNLLSFPVWERIRWHVPARGQQPPVTFTWHHGPDYAPGSRQMLQQLLGDHGASAEDLKELLVYAGAALVGDKGLLVANSHNNHIWLLPKARFADVDIKQPKRLPSSPGHYREWLVACRGGREPLASFQYTAIFNEFLMLGDVATRFPGETLCYNPRLGKITNHAAADGALGYQYRQGWTL